MTVSTGRGSFLNESGEVEMDASVMEGLQLGVGAVASVRNFLHPARIAFDVMRYTPHALLVGEGAEDFATQRGHVRLAPEELVCERERAVFSSWIAAGRPDAKVFFAAAAESFAGQESHKRGTVGVVVGLRNGDGVWQLYCGTRCDACVHVCCSTTTAVLLTFIIPARGARPGRKKEESVTYPSSVAVSMQTMNLWRSVVRDGGRGSCGYQLLTQLQQWCVQASRCKSPSKQPCAA